MCAFTACVRFLRRRGPAGLRSLLFFGYSVVIFAPPCSLSQTWKHSCSNGWTHTLPQTRPKTTWKSRMRAGMLPSPKESHTAAHKGKQGVLLCRGARQYSKPEESDVHLRLLSRAKAGTHSALLKGSHTAAHTPKQGRFGWGVVSLPSDRSARSQTSPGRVSERQTLPLLGLGRGCSRRTQKAFGTAMRLCVSLFRRRRSPAGLRDLFATW